MQHVQTVWRTKKHEFFFLWERNNPSSYNGSFNAILVGGAKRWIKKKRVDVVDLKSLFFKRKEPCVCASTHAANQSLFDESKHSHRVDQTGLSSSLWLALDQKEKGFSRIIDDLELWLDNFQRCWTLWFFNQRWPVCEDSGVSTSKQTIEYQKPRKIQSFSRELLKYQNMSALRYAFLRKKTTRKCNKSRRPFLPR